MFQKINDWIVEAMGYDGIVHCLISALLTALIGIFTPWWLAAIIVLVIGAAKELYDKWSGKGNAEVQDMMCNIIGIIIGAL